MVHKGSFATGALMAVEAYPDQLEPENQDAVIWRFMDMKKFRDLVATGELYFCRADLFDDEREGLPPEEYLPILGLNPFDLRDRRELSHHIGSDAQFRESFYISCWQLFLNETAEMWKNYGEDGVAICSRYRLLKSALDVMGDRAFLGLVRYGSKHLTGWNSLRFITTKRMKYAFYACSRYPFSAGAASPTMKFICGRSGQCHSHSMKPGFASTIALTISSTRPP